MTFLHFRAGFIAVVSRRASNRSPPAALTSRIIRAAAHGLDTWLKRSGEQREGLEVDKVEKMVQG